MNDIFHKIASRVSIIVGSPFSFITSVLIIVTWGLTGSIFHYSDTWQLIINTGTTIVTFLMVFLIQNTQNRDAKAIHLKIDELLKVTKGARNGMVNIEDLSDRELESLHEEFHQIHVKYEAALERRKLRKIAKLNGN